MTENGAADDSENKPENEALEAAAAEEQQVAMTVENCLATVLSFYGIRVDIRGIVAEVPKEKLEALRFEHLEHIAEKLQLKLSHKMWDMATVCASDIPVMLVLKDGGGAVYFPEKTHGGKFYIPGRVKQEKTREEIEQEYGGEAYLLYPPREESGAETVHMQKGHRLDWFWSPIVGYWKSYSEIIVSSFFINMLMITLPLYTMNIYDSVVVNFAESTLFVLTAGIMIAICFDFLFKTVRVYILERVAADVGAKYDFDLMERLLLIKAQHMKLSVGERANLFRELQGIRDFYAGRLAPTLVDLPFFFLFISVIFMISAPLASIPIIGAVLIIIINLGAQMQINRSTEEYFSSMQSKSTVLIETLAGMQAVKMFNAVGGRLFQWNIAAARSTHAARKNHFLTATISNLSMLITHLCHITVVFSGVYEIHANNLTVGGLIACTILSGRAIAPVISVAGTLARLKQSHDVLKTIDKIFQLPYEGQATVHKAPKGPFRGGIELQHVTYQYEGQTKPALHQVSLTIAPGERVGLIGRSGAGKSTIIRLMTGFITPQEGHVLLDGYGLETIPSTELRRTVGYVPQDAFFFSGSIQSNILLGAEETGEEELDRVVKLSGLDLFMQQTGQGLDTEVGENGQRLSGGQKQAISLARAIVRNPRLVILDEPTTGMDSALEGRVKTALLEFMQDRTFIMVTHRTGLLSMVNRLVVLDRGKIIADGPRDEILRQLSGQAA